MPFILTLGVFLILGGLISIQHNNAVYQQHVMASSMNYKEQLPLWGGTSKGNLSLGHTRLSRDGKTLAVEIIYDETAHSALSSYGNRYKLRLVDTKDNRMKDVKLSYGIFGTDGSGVLTIHSPKGFKNSSFVVMIIDNGQLVTSDDLNQTQMSDTELDKSITAELSSTNSPDDSNQNSSDNKKNLPPLYYVRLNAKNVKRNYRNWNNDSELIQDLFINENLASLNKKMKVLQAKITKAKRTMKEMNARLKENPNDEVAQNNKNDISGTLNSLQDNYKAAKKRYRKLENSTFKDNILDPQQHKYRAYTVDDINNMR